MPIFEWLAAVVIIFQAVAAGLAGPVGPGYQEPVTAVITEAPTPEPTATLTPDPTATPTPEPTATPTPEPTAAPTAEPTATPTAEPTAAPTAEPTATPTAEPTAAPTPEPADLDEDRMGEWYAVYMKTGRLEGTPQKLTGMDITLTLKPDHTAVLNYAGAGDSRRWSVAGDGTVRFGEDTLILRADGFLILRTSQDSYMVFHQDKKATWKPGTSMEP